MFIHFSIRPFYLWNLFVIRYAKYQKASVLNNQVLLLDEGPLQNIISYPQSKLSSDRVSALVKSLPRNELIIFFDISPELRKQYLQKRNRPSWRERSKMVEEWEMVMEQNASQLREFFKDQGNCYFVQDYTADEDVVTVIKAYENDEKLD